MICRGKISVGMQSLSSPSTDDLTNWIAQPSSIDRLGAVCYTRWSVERASVVTRNGENILIRIAGLALFDAMKSQSGLRSTLAEMFPIRGHLSANLS